MCNCPVESRAERGQHNMSHLRSAEGKDINSIVPQLPNNSTNTLHIAPPTTQMSGYKSFAVAGAGNIGLPIVHALAAQNVSVVVLSRPESATKEFPPGVQIAKVDFNDVAAISAVLKAHKVDVVLSTIPAPAAAAQKPLVDASKLAKVKLFAPSEYGMPSDGHSEGVPGEKNKLVGKFRLASLAPQI